MQIGSAVGDSTVVSEIEQRFHFLADSCVNLIKSMSKLENRLIPVVIPENPSVLDDDDEVPFPNLVPLARKLYELNSVVMTATYRLNDLRSRLAL